ncbi:hypothetical protein LI82_11880 [Methanococcoides methylutens]|uniref:Uncharacterized protein n=1 Tax=Methanococcoides methylutens TaxID=2226 RepID=A0A099T0B2_METMT|nr:flippase [Methanococcoides methylutens]KGK98394.1 hypothetical protein LI82_11880 [Methanococcoides methylutens]
MVNVLSLREKLLKETFWSFATKGISFSLYFLLNIYLARVLGAEKFGAWSFFYSILTIVLLFSYFGINSSARKYVAQYNRDIELYNILKSSAKLRLMFSLFFSIVIIFIHRPLAILVGRPEFASFFLLCAPLILLAGLVEFLKAIFMGLHRIKYNFIINFIEYGLKLLLVFLALKLSLDVISIINSFTIAYFVASTVGFYLLWIKYFKRNNAKSTDGFSKEILKYSIPLFFISIGFLIATEVDTLMLGLLATDTEVGIYSVAKQITIKLPHISLAIAMGSMPVFAKLNKDNKESLKKMFYKLLKVNALIFSTISLVIIFLSWYFIPLIFGIEYLGSVLPLQLLTVYLISYSFSIFLSTFLDYQGLAKKRAFNLLICVILNIGLNYLLIPLYGAIGAATATSISYLPYVCLNWIEVRKFLK